jgi:AraC-like DNA-binding protein
MNEHASQKCSVEDIAKELYISKFYFCRLFKKEMGITPKQYMTQTKLRMLKTKIMEKETETKIAEDMDFAAQSHMCSIFKKYMGVSIKEYKNNLTIK